ncbi:MAG: zinc ribbon domain-containing protein [Actinobacteria bacterium]|nr:zinc ribbon domain-containing protein [Actinomycetota bacterium]
MGEEERTCPRCGAALKEGARFCTSCGRRIDTAGGAEVGTVAGREEAVAAGVPGGAGTGEAGVAPALPPQPDADAQEPGMLPGPARAAGRSRAPLLLGVLGGLLLLAGAVILVLYLAVWREGAGGTGDPVALARKYMEALERKDVDAYLDCFEEGFFSLEDNPLLEGMDLDPRELVEMSFIFMEVSFEGVELDLRRDEGDGATVVTTAGMMSLSIMGMEEEVDLADDPLEFRMARKGGRWYLTEDPMPTLLGGDLDLFGDDMDMDMDRPPDGYDLEDLEKYLPEEWDLEELEDLRPEDLEELMRELMEELEEPPQHEGPPDETVTWKGRPQGCLAGCRRV